VRILLGKNGEGQLEVLSVLADQGKLKHKKIVRDSSLSKGAVSNNVEKLGEKNLLIRNDEIKLDKERILKLYREHIESFLVRDSESPEELNDTRTFVKKNIREIIQQKEIENILLSVLSQARNRQDLESLNSVFKETDRVILETCENEGKLIGIVTDKSNNITENPEIAEEAQRILNEVKE